MRIQKLALLVYEMGPELDETLGNFIHLFVHVKDSESFAGTLAPKLIC